MLFLGEHPGVVAVSAPGRSGRRQHLLLRKGRARPLRPDSTPQKHPAPQALLSPPGGKKLSRGQADG